MAARTATEAGLRVLLIDSKPIDDIGDKACGNVVSASDLDRVGIRHPKEIYGVLKGVKVFSPDQKTIFTIDLKHFVLNRHALGQKLLSDATRAGAEFFSQTEALDLVIRDGKTVGIKTARGKILSKLVIDASGYHAVIRNKLPSVEKVRGEDTGVCYLEIRELEEQIDPNYVLVYLKGVGNGYCWVIPERENRANIGIGVQGAPNHPSPKTLFYKHVFFWFNLGNSKLIRARGGIVPTRGPVCPLSANDVMFVGDAGCQTNPVSACGIGLSLMAGKIAGEVAADVVEGGIDLNEYHKRYMDAHGRQQVTLDAFRRFLLRVTDSDLNYTMRELLTEDEIKRIVVGEGVKLTMWKKIKMVSKGISRPQLLWKLWKALRG